jgi:hypothetical protein
MAVINSDPIVYTRPPSLEIFKNKSSSSLSSFCSPHPLESRRSAGVDGCLIFRPVLGASLGPSQRPPSLSNPSTNSHSFGQPPRPEGTVVQLGSANALIRLGDLLLVLIKSGHREIERERENREGHGVIPSCPRPAADAEVPAMAM